MPVSHVTGTPADGADTKFTSRLVSSASETLDHGTFPRQISEDLELQQGWAHSNEAKSLFRECKTLADADPESTIPVPLSLVVRSVLSLSTVLLRA